MQIQSQSAFTSGINLIQSGQALADQAAAQIARSSVSTDDTTSKTSDASSNTGGSSARSQSSNQQLERLHSVDRSQQPDLAASLVELSMSKIETGMGVKVAKASDEVLGTLIDTHA